MIWAGCAFRSQPCDPAGERGDGRAAGRHGHGAADNLTEKINNSDRLEPFQSISLSRSNL
jgi:hypothetical protein